MNFKIWSAWVITTGYAIIRYNVVGPVSWDNLPVYILNKGISFTSAVYLFYSSWNAFKGNKDKVAEWGRYAYYAVILHVLLSLAFYSPEYFAKMYGDEKMNIWGEMMILCGVLGAFVFYYIPKITHILTRLQTMHMVSGLLLALHVFFLGGRGWSNVPGWYGGLPPISLLSFLLAILAFVFYTLAMIHSSSESK